jgi:hypothetical protein
MKTSTFYQFFGVICLLTIIPQFKTKNSLINDSSYCWSVKYVHQSLIKFIEMNEYDCDRFPRKIIFKQNSFCEISNDDIDLLLNMLNDTTNCPFVFDSRWSLGTSSLVNCKKYKVSSIQLEAYGIIEGIKSGNYPAVLTPDDFIDTLRKDKALLSLEMKKNGADYLETLRK